MPRGGRSAASTAAAADWPLPVNATPTDRVCYPLAPNERRKKQGQVVEGTSFGVALSAIAALPTVKRVLELGTWYGGGSTVNLARGIRESAVSTNARSLGASAPPDNCIESPSAAGITQRCCHSLVVTVEVFEPAWEHARRYLRDWPVWCVRGSTVAAEEMLTVSPVGPSRRSSISPRRPRLRSAARSPARGRRRGQPKQRPGARAIAWSTRPYMLRPLARLLNASLRSDAERPSVGL